MFSANLRISANSSTFKLLFTKTLHLPNPQTYDEKELLLRIADSNEQAFAAFVYKHTGGLYSYILKITKSEQWAEELVQDVWVQVWTARHHFAALDNPVAYLHRMAQNRSLDWIRKNKRELKLQYLLQQHLTFSSTDPIAEKSDFENARLLLVQAISGLPAQRRRILELKQSGLSYEMIAATLQISKNTVRNQMVSAFHSLREYLNQHGKELILIFYYFFS